MDEEWNYGNVEMLMAANLFPMLPKLSGNGRSCGTHLATSLTW